MVGQELLFCPGASQDDDDEDHGDDDDEDSDDDIYDNTIALNTMMTMTPILVMAFMTIKMHEKRWQR